MLDYRVYLASVKVIWVVLGGLGCCRVVILDCRVYSASVYAICVVLGVWGVAGCLCLLVLPLCRRFGWF